MASEDMSFILEDVPGMYFFVGSSNEKLGLTYGHHHPRFDFDEDALPLGVALGSAAIADYLMPATASMNGKTDTTITVSVDHDTEEAQTVSVQKP